MQKIMTALFDLNRTWIELELETYNIHMADIGTMVQKYANNFVMSTGGGQQQRCDHILCHSRHIGTVFNENSHWAQLAVKTGPVQRRE